MSADLRDKIALTPYVYLYGKAAEALEYYKAVFGGAYEVAMRGENDTISHAEFRGDGFKLMISDGGSKRSVDPNAGNVSLQLAIADREEARRIFDALRDGGGVKVPFEVQAWGGALGIVHDRFGTEWIITA